MGRSLCRRPCRQCVGAQYRCRLQPFFRFSDIRLKRDIAVIGRLDSGLGLYRYRYLWGDTVYVGVMAQEVALIRPEAVVRDAWMIISGWTIVASA